MRIHRLVRVKPNREAHHRQAASADGPAEPARSSSIPTFVQQSFVQDIPRAAHRSRVHSGMAGSYDDVLPAQKAQALQRMREHGGHVLSGRGPQPGASDAASQFRNPVTVPHHLCLIALVNDQPQ
jgi:hypothetical protein